MSAALRPEFALAYLRELSPEIERCSLQDREGRLLAGDPLPAGASPGDDPIFVGDEQLTLAVLAGARTPRMLVEFDARLALAAVRGRC